MYRWTKVVIFILVLMMAAAVSTPAVQPTEAKTASGTFDYWFDFVNPPQVVNGNTILYAIEYETWTGTFEGTAIAVFVVIIHESGVWSVDLLSTFTGTVNGEEEGSLVIQLIGERPSDTEDWFGDWVILRGIGDLEDLRGRGTWGGPGTEAAGPGDVPDIPGDWDDIWYEGTIHFDDDDDDDDDDDWDDDWDEDDWDDDEDEEDDD